MIDWSRTIFLLYGRYSIIHIMDYGRLSSVKQVIRVDDGALSNSCCALVVIRDKDNRARNRIFFTFRIPTIVRIESWTHRVPLGGQVGSVWH